MVMRYFGNKEGLFAAASEIDLRLPQLADVPRERPAPAWSATSWSAGRATRR